MSLRRWWFAILCATTVAALPTKWAESQEKKAPATAKATTKKDDPDATTKADDGKDVAELKKQLATTAKELEAVKKDAADAARSAAAAMKAVAELKVDAATKAATSEKAIAELKAANTPDPKKAEEEKKAAEAAAKATADGITAASDKGGDAAKRADTAWMLTASAFVLFMVPGLALFYGGMVRRKNVLATMMQSMAALAVVGLYWLAVGYALAFGPSVLKTPDGLLGVKDGGGLIGWSWDLVFLKGVKYDDVLTGYNIPVYLHVMFQGMFAIITPALISGAIAERIRFWPFCVFMLLWVTFVYCPLAHMVWAFDWFDPTVLAAKRGGSAIGLLGKMGALDFAGGTVVHIAAGMAGLACCLVLRRRAGYPKMVAHPNSMVLTLLGAGMLWFGWFGFNGGSALNGTAQAVSAFAATQAAAAAAGLAWMLVEWLHKGKPTALGLASGIVAGLVAVTPASGYVFPYGGVAIGVAAAVICYLAVTAKGLLGYDDSLDAFGVHGVGGFVGAVLTGVFCSTAIYPGGGDGYFAYNANRARYAELKPPSEGADAKPIQTAKAGVEKAGKDVEAAEAEAKKVPADNKDATAEAEKKVADAKDVKADKDATLAGLEKELATLKALVEKQDDTANNGKDKKTALSQVMIQVKAAVFSAVFAFAASLALAALVQAMTLGNFSTSKKDEAEGLDRTEHGEVGFDFSAATESVSVVSAEPRAATIPAGNGRYDVELAGADPSELMKVWSGLCQPSDRPTDPDFLAVYPNVTTIRGTMFRCRGGDHADVAKRLASLFKKHTGKDVKAIKVT